MTSNNAGVPEDINQTVLSESPRAATSWIAPILDDLRSWPVNTWLVAALVLLLYIPVLAETIPYWLAQETYSFCILIGPISLALIILLHQQVRGTTKSPSVLGFWVAVVGVVIEWAGWYLRVRFIAMAALPVVISGAVIALHGMPLWRKRRVPLAFRLFAAPIPEPVLTPTDVMAQRISTIGAQWIMQFLGFAIVREGSVLQVPGMALNVAEACSGFKKLIAFFCFAVLYGWFFNLPRGKWILLIIVSFPIALAANIIRIAGLVALATWFGAHVEAVAHEYADYFVIALSCVLFVSVGRRLGCEKTRFSQD